MGTGRGVAVVARCSGPAAHAIIARLQAEQFRVVGLDPDKPLGDLSLKIDLTDRKSTIAAIEHATKDLGPVSRPGPGPFMRWGATRRSPAPTSSRSCRRPASALRDRRRLNRDPAGQHRRIACVHHAAQRRGGRVLHLVRLRDHLAAHPAVPRQGGPLNSGAVLCRKVRQPERGRRLHLAPGHRTLPLDDRQLVQVDVPYQPRHLDLITLAVTGAAAYSGLSSLQRQVTLKTCPSLGPLFL